MTRRLATSVRSSGLAALVVLGWLGTVHTASAQAAPTCTTNSDCPKGFSCQMSGASACPGYACAVPAGDVDAAPSCPPPPACTPTVIMSCLPGPCSTDSDCAAGMVCYAQTYPNCPAPAPEPLPSCPANADCSVPASDAGPCTATTTVKSCVPKYAVPCQVDSDCGPGFTCQPDVQTNCSGAGAPGGTGGLPAGSAGSGPVATGASPPASDAGVVGVVPDPTCTTTTSSTSSCVANTIPCASAGDCPAMWTCTGAAQPAIAVCNGPISVDGAVPECTVPDASPSPMLCEPPYASLGFGSGGSFSAGSVTGGSGSVPAPQAAAASDGPAGSGQGSSHGGCQVTGVGAPSAAGLPLLALLGLALGRRRRR